MADLLDRIREELNLRLTELRPLIEERDRLDAALRALGEGESKASGPRTTGSSAPRTTASSAPVASRGRTASKATSAKRRTTSSTARAARSPRGAPPATPAKPQTRARPGANRQAVLQAAGERPGASSAELSVASGVERNTLYGLLSRLVKAGELETVSLPSGQTGYALSSQRPADLAGDAGGGAAVDAATVPPAEVAG